MADLPHTSDATNPTDDALGVDATRRVATPRWVIVAGVVVLVIVLLVALMFIIGGGDHGPGRHTSGGEMDSKPAAVGRA